MRNIAIDLGTSNTLIYVNKKGVVLNESTAIAFDLNDNLLIAAGEAAKQMIGRTGENVAAIRPLKGGVIADFAATVAMLKHFMKKAVKHTVYTGSVLLLAVPSGATTVEKRAATEALSQLGAKNVVVIESVLAAAVGVGMGINDAKGAMLVHMGGGTTEIAVITLGKIAVSKTLRYGGDDIDEAIINHIKKEKNVLIGQTTAETIKIEIGNLYSEGTQTHHNYRGRDLISGLPRTFSLCGDDIRRVLEESLTTVAEEIKKVVEQAPPELVAAVLENGFILSGGGAKLQNAAQFFAEKTCFKCACSAEPQEAAVLGLGKILDEKTYKRFIK